MPAWPWHVEKCLFFFFWYGLLRVATRQHPASTRRRCHKRTQGEGAPKEGLDDQLAFMPRKVILTTGAKCAAWGCAGVRNWQKCWNDGGMDSWWKSLVKYFTLEVLRGTMRGGAKRRQIEYAFQKYTTPCLQCLHHALCYYLCCSPNPPEKKLNFEHPISGRGKLVLKIANQIIGGEKPCFRNRQLEKNILIQAPG